MNILVISQYYEPEPFLIHDKIKELIIYGHKVTVVTGLPNYPKGEIIDGYYPGKTEKDGVEIIRVNLRPRKKGSKNLFLNYLSFINESTKVIKSLKTKFDLIYVYQLSPVLMALPAIKYKRINKVPLIIYCLDLWPASLISGGIKKGSIPYRVFKLLSKRIYKKADSIHISSRQFEKYFNDELNIYRNFIYNPQYSVPLDSYIDQNSNIFDNKKINITFTGNVGEMQSLDTIIHSMKNINNNVILHIVGDGSKLNDLKLLTNKLNLKERVIFHGRKPADLMGKYMFNSDALVVSMKKDEVISYTLPAKIQSYLQSGKFIIGSINGEAADVILDSKAGIVAPAEDVISFSNLVNDFIENKDRYADCGKNGPKYYEQHFGKDRFIKVLLEDMRRMAE
ncbi:glycosyltransferase family 4 protein [Macrococcus capreoli]